MKEDEKPALLRRAHLRGVTVRNRVIVSPMCQYSAGYDGLATDFHMVHLGQFALGGAGIVFTEATGITAQGRRPRLPRSSPPRRWPSAGSRIRPTCCARGEVAEAGG